MKDFMKKYKKCIIYITMYIIALCIIFSVLKQPSKTFWIHSISFFGMTSFIETIKIVNKKRKNK